MPKTLMNLNPRDCRYILNNDSGRAALFCAEPSVPGESWCRQHYDLCFDRVPVHKFRSPIMLPIEKMAAPKEEIDFPNEL